MSVANQYEVGRDDDALDCAIDQLTLGVTESTPPPRPTVGGTKRRCNPFVCLSVSDVPLVQQRCILVLWLL